MSLPALHTLKGIVLDIEGTTTPISFVYDALFPFARKHMRRWLETHLESETGAKIVAQFRELSEADRKDGLDAPILEDGPELADQIVEYALAQMDSDRKTTALKSVQGEIWKSGYESGELQGVVWDDVTEALERWRVAGVPVWIYSSGSVSAQKLLFGFSDHGDLLPWIAGHFDTTTGPKKVAESYRQIASKIGATGPELLFATDNLAEAEAASEADWNVVLLRRPGNPEVDEHPFVEASDFTELP